MKVWERLRDMVLNHGAAALVSIHDVKGSAPRESGARMIVRPDGAFHGSIGGGQLEWQTLKHAADLLAEGPRAARFFDQALGPDLGQCCGGRVKVLIETFDRGDAIALEALAQTEREGPFEVQAVLKGGRIKRDVVGATGLRWPAFLNRDRWRERYGEVLTPVLLFGAGHVGRALVLALAPLPFTVTWVDDRPEAFPAHIPANVRLLAGSDPVAEVNRAPPGSLVLVMTHDHALDLAITATALLRPFPYVGLIGSATKRARFEKRFRELGIGEERIATLVSPVGVPGISGKEPAVIAASVTAQLLLVRDRAAAERT
ncbi:xanthine dehydrogenase accessory protein XdhC [Microvirga pudoricolor]|uniref:xanthine dehydrogenase accessory protein XdhC n=1 Tax=Microvirga pudoricolor TaxID=2778729 RepID=UPI00194DEE68|nr:xanthine dehydrogenase accessory protein XdhC [Microvirga pudoricolor]MBM6594665.1 xanthine dehydrogenase accessory protein XdhC [Microvirga pudoricolor]